MIATWLALILIGLLTFFTRLSFITLLDRWKTPAWLTNYLQYIPPAVLSAIILPELLIHQDSLGLWPINPRLIAGVVAIAVGVKTGNAIFTILAGMGSLYLFQLLFG